MEPGWHVCVPAVGRLRTWVVGTLQLLYWEEVSVFHQSKEGGSDGCLCDTVSECSAAKAPRLVPWHACVFHIPELQECPFLLSQVMFSIRAMSWGAHLAFSSWTRAGCRGERHTPGFSPTALRRFCPAPATGLCVHDNGTFLFLLKKNGVYLALTSVAQLVWHHPAKWKVAGSIPSQGPSLSCGFSPWSGHLREATHWCFTLTLKVLTFSFSLPSLLSKINK